VETKNSREYKSVLPLDSPFRIDDKSEDVLQVILKTMQEIKNELENLRKDMEKIHEILRKMVEPDVTILHLLPVLGESNGDNS